ncbi:MAG: hypothetical protein JKY17_06075 [Magnetovibrio sp.]|nr:hypothetical protein [Magnetovibrio sp.]
MKLSYKHQNSDEVVETEGWASDALSYEEGAREKSTVFSPNPPPFAFLLPEHRYLSKKSNDRAPSQFWIEVVAYRFGCLCGVPVPPAFVSVDSKGGCRALIEWFYEDWKNVNSYVSGYSLLLDVDADLDKKKGLRHCLPTLKSGIEGLQKNIILRFISYIVKWVSNGAVKECDFDAEFLKMFTFDALIGNTDRHHENWGLIVNLAKIKQRQKTSFLSLSPAFDNGTSLGYDFVEAKLDVYMSNPGWFDQFAKNKKAVHHLRKTPEGEQFKHDELIGVLLQERPDLASMVEKIISFDINDVRDMLNELTKFDVPVRFTPERAEFSAKIIEAKRNLLKAVIK